VDLIVRANTITGASGEGTRPAPACLIKTTLPKRNLSDAPRMESGYLIECYRQRSDASAGGMEDGVRHGGGNTDDSELPDAFDAERIHRVRLTYEDNPVSQRQRRIFLNGRFPASPVSRASEGSAGSWRVMGEASCGRCA
jgi:hypothetical protein